MILDPQGEFIRTILDLEDIANKALLEIGSGTGRITRDLAEHARMVYALEPDEAALQTAKSAVKSKNVTYLNLPAEYLRDLPEPVDLAVYSLSLHHIAPQYMSQTLETTTRLLAESGSMLVIEPGSDGSFIELEEKFGIGCGNERTAKANAKRAIEGMSDWGIERSIDFQTQFYFENVYDFLEHTTNKYWEGDKVELTRQLEKYTTCNGVELYADRTAYLLKPKTTYQSIAE